MPCDSQRDKTWEKRPLGGDQNANKGEILFPLLQWPLFQSCHTVAVRSSTYWINFVPIPADSNYPRGGSPFERGRLHIIRPTFYTFNAEHFCHI